MRLSLLRKNRKGTLFLLGFMAIIIGFTLLFTFNAIPVHNTNINDDPIDSRQVYAVTMYTNASYYQSDWYVYMTAYFEDDVGGAVSGALVSFQVDDPSTTTLYFDTSYTNSSGWANQTYHLPSSASEGTWWVYVSADDGR